MATQLEPGAEGAEEQAATDPNGTATEAGTQDAGAETTDEPSPYDELAQRLGWVPRDQYTGPPENWKPAEQFIVDGRDIQRDTARELKSLRNTVETMARTTASVVESEVQQRVEKLTRDFQAAVDEGDTEGALKISTEIHKVAAPVAGGRPAPSPDAQDFAARNAGWFQKDPLATTRAIEISNSLALQGYDHATQLASVEKQIRREFPHLFKTTTNGKAAPGVHQPGSRGGGPSNRAKGFSDLPKEAQDVARDMVARGVITGKTDQEALGRYAENYWKNAEGKR